MNSSKTNHVKSRNKNNSSFSNTNYKPLKIIIVSDVHLGYQNTDKESFKKFLENLQTDEETTDLVLLGDIVDMWRRDASGVFLEHTDIIQQLINLKQKMRIHYVAGNHDYHVLQLRGHAYPFNFTKNLKFIDGNITYNILHGYEFDKQQKSPIMEALCHVMYDPIENFMDFFDLTQIPETRLSHSLDDIERRACSTAKEKEILVFGHTHHPFINKEENIANSGSWVIDSPIHNTIVELSCGKPKLSVFGEREITERIEY